MRNSNERMVMHPDGEKVLAAMNDASEFNMYQISERVGEPRGAIRNAVDWLFLNGFISKRKDIVENVNLYANKSHKTVCQKMLHAKWVREDILLT